MKHFLYIITLILSVTSCDNKPETTSNSSLTNKQKADTTIIPNTLTFPFEINFSNPNISNKSDREIDLLFNGVNNYLGGQRNPKVDFYTECLQCEQVQKRNGGLLFAKHLLIMPDQIKYYKNFIPTNDSINLVKFKTPDEKNKNLKFQFSDGNASIKYLGISCDDADFNKVRITYPTGEIIIDSLINASFFEYDLNMNGVKEQYLFGTRTCSQEFVLLRIRKSSDLH